MNALRGYFDDLISLFFPELCPACDRSLVKHENVLCTDCIYHLPYTGFNTDNENRVVRQLWGRFPFVHADAFLFYNKGGRVQNMMHRLKYRNCPEVGFRLGELYGNHLKGNPSWVAPDILIPVPLHARKLKKRGYNQAEQIAMGISAATNIPVEAYLIVRSAKTETQTKKSRYSRHENMKNAFTIVEPDKLRKKHVLLVDDVITTGATFESLATTILNLEETRVSIAALAFTD